MSEAFNRWLFLQERCITNVYMVRNIRLDT